jgi:zinc transporter 1
MALSKSQRMYILLAINSLFFFIELSVGIAVHSLALVADSFHMLNDVFSLCVGLWAVHVKNSKPSKQFTYGWQTAETLGALVNGVFLVALCMSIGLEAIERLFNPPEIKEPKWILGVGSAGLAMNILGLFLFHDHGHSHGGHSHGHGDEEEGLLGADGEPEEHGIVDPSVRPTTSGASRRRSSDVRSPPGFRKQRSLSRGYNALDGIPSHPASIRNDIINASKLGNIQDNGSEATLSEDEEAVEDTAVTVASTSHYAGPNLDPIPRESTPLLQDTSSQPPVRKTVTFNGNANSTSLIGEPIRRRTSSHKSRPAQSNSHGGHSHADLNMRAVFLHVLGDALGNIGVIATALFIWLTPYWWRFYFDPVVSLLIACIILASALPLCRAAARILLLAVPTGVSVDNIKADILNLPGVVSCHHVHVWQLSDTTLVASLHVRVACKDSSTSDGASTGGEYMQLARQIRKTLHGHGIHSTTIQPEFCDPGTHVKANGVTGVSSCGEEDTGSEAGGSNGAAKRHAAEEGTGCLLDCEDDCAPEGRCCRTGTGGLDGDSRR